MSGVEFRKWMAFYMLEPFGNEWQQNAQLEASIKNAFGGKQGGGQFKPEDCMPVPKREQTQASIEANLVAALGPLPSGKKNDGKQD